METVPRIKGVALNFQVKFIYFLFFAVYPNFPEDPSRYFFQ